MKVFIISLKRSIERRARMNKEMHKIGMNFEFFDAADASMPNFICSERAAPHITKKRKGYTLITNEIACYASHFMLWQQCVTLNEPIVILEDNINLLDDFKSVLKEITLQINDLNYIKLSATIIDKKRKFSPVIKLNNHFSIGCYSKGTSGTTGYVISPIAAKKFIENSAQFIAPVDDFMEKPWIHKIKAYSVNPAICSRSNITSTIGNLRKVKKNLTFLDKLRIEYYNFQESILRLIWNHLY